jgi:hypothetical protein
MSCPGCGVGINIDTNRLSDAADEIRKAVNKVPPKITISCCIPSRSISTVHHRQSKVRFQQAATWEVRLGMPVRAPRSAAKLSASVAAVEAMAEAVVRVEVLEALSQVAILLV